jgi:acetyl-CoA carboxylase biotin carboxyl carrier protein
MDIKELEYILSLLKKNDVTEFDLTHDGTQVKVKRGSALEISGGGHGISAADLQRLLAASPQAVAGSVAAPSASVAPDALKNENLVKVDSPIVGTFYRRPSPDAEPFAREGDFVKKGQTLCIIEAMKLMNEIVAPCSGRIDKVLLADGQVVEFGEVIFLIDPDS